MLCAGPGQEMGASDLNEITGTERRQGTQQSFVNYIDIGLRNQQSQRCSHRGSIQYGHGYG